MNIIGIILLIAGVYMVSGALIIKTNNLWAATFFKVFPFFIGVACLLAGVKTFGWI